MSQAKVIKGLMLNGRTGRVIVYTDGVDQHLNFADASSTAQAAINTCLAELQKLVNTGNLYKPSKSGADQKMIECGQAVQMLIHKDDAPF